MPESGPAARLVILADDLTGAADCAARCRGAGLTAEICVQVPAAVPPCNALALTSDSRHVPAAEAAGRVRAVLSGLALEPDTVWYKKIDSTGRGNLGAEIDAMLEALGHSIAVVCPAFPAQARGLRDGFVVGADGPAPPVHVPSLLAQQSRHAVTALDLAQVRRGAHQLRRRVLGIARAGAARIVVLDAMDDRDLATIVAALQELPVDALLCGSAGLVGALAAGRAPAATLPAACHPELDQPALIVVGSGSRAAHLQIAYARRRNVETVDPHNSSDGQHGGDTLYHLALPAADACLDGAAARSLVHELAAAALAALRPKQAALLILVGGDTAIEVLRRLGISHLTVLRELLPGMPLARATDRSGLERWIILKSGNHGAESTLLDLLDLVRAHTGRTKHYGAG